MEEPTTTSAVLAAPNPPHGDAIEAIADLTRKGVQADVERIADRNGVERLLLVKTNDGAGNQNVELWDLDDQGDQGPPDRRVRGTYTLHTIDALVDYVAPFVTDYSTAWVDGENASIEVVLDDHAARVDAERGDEQPAGLREHRAKLQLKDSPEWAAWAKIDAQYVPQEQFATFLEDWIRTVVDPPAAKLLELVTAFEATTSGQFKSAVRLDNGERQLVYEETITEGGKSKGGAGTVKLPSEITLSLRRFVGEDAQRVKARFRWRKTGPVLVFGVVLDDVDEITEMAVDQIKTKLTAAVPRTFSGTGARA
ncbi:MAG: DUF2303 family protein [Patulibacter minatonensis]